MISFPALALAAALGRNEVLVCGVAAEAERRGVDPVIACALVEHESNFRPGARSATHDYGLMQIHEPLHGYYPDTRKHVEKGMDILRRDLDREHGNYRRALSRYNTGKVGRRGLAYARRVLSIAARLNRQIGRGRIWYSHRCSARLLQPDCWWSWEPGPYDPRKRRVLPGLTARGVEGDARRSGHPHHPPAQVGRQHDLPGDRRRPGHHGDPRVLSPAAGRHAAPAPRDGPKDARKGADRMSDELAGLLGTALLCDPACATTIMVNREFRRLLRLSRGKVLIQRRTWRIKGRRAFCGWTRVCLREE